MYQVYMVFFSVRKLSILKIKTYLFACEIIFGQIIFGQIIFGKILFSDFLLLLPLELEFLLLMVW